MGAQLIKVITTRFQDVKVTAVGTNTTATSAMIKAGIKKAATGENPVIVACRKADIIIGPIGIVIADSMYGEITPAMAMAIGQADATRILIPVNKCENMVAGIGDVTMSSMIDDIIIKLERMYK